MAVYRVTEGFTRKEVAKLKALFDRVAVRPTGGGPREVMPDRLFDAMVHMFGPQSIGLAKKLARRFAAGDHTDPVTSDTFNSSYRTSTAFPSAPGAQSMFAVTGTSGFVGDDAGYSEFQPGLPFPEFLLWARRLREAEIEEFRKQFKAADLDNSGVIQADEIRQVIQNCGYLPLRAIVSEVTKEVDCDENGTLEFEEFVNLMAVFRRTDGFCAKEVAELTQIFNTFKTEQNGEECVNCLQLTDILRSMGYVTNLDVVRKFIKQVDFDNSNTLDLPEFIRLMRMHRETELQEALRVFTEETDYNGRSNVDTCEAKQMLESLGYNPSEKLLGQALNELIDFDEGEEDTPEELDFDAFVHVIDHCRKGLRLLRVKHAGYSDEEVESFKAAFDIYDEDHNGDIERHELTKLLTDLGVPMRTKQQQAEMLEKLDLAREQAREAGVEEFRLGNAGDPKVRFHVLLFLVRMLAKAADSQEVDRDQEIMEKTKFTPKEAEEFREIFSFWAAKSAALDAGNEAPQVQEIAARSISMLQTPKEAEEEAARNQLMTKDGMRRVVRSLGLQMTPSDSSMLKNRLEMGPEDKDNPGKYGFFEFLIFMRWMLDTNFCHINEKTALDAERANNA